MAAQIVQLLEDEVLRQEMSRRAAEDAKKRFDLRRQVEEYVEWYKRVINENEWKSV